MGINKSFWKEYSIIQAKIDNYGNSSNFIKGLLLPTASAALYVSLTSKSLFIPIVGFFSTLLLCFYELQNFKSKRILEISALRIEKKLKWNKFNLIESPTISARLKTKIDLQKINWKRRFKIYFIELFFYIFFGTLFIIISISNFNYKNNDYYYFKDTDTYSEIKYKSNEINTFTKLGNACYINNNDIGKSISVNILNQHMTEKLILDTTCLSKLDFITRIIYNKGISTSDRPKLNRLIFENIFTETIKNKTGIMTKLSILLDIEGKAVNNDN